MLCARLFPVLSAVLSIAALTPAIYSVPFEQLASSGLEVPRPIRESLGIRAPKASAVSAEVPAGAGYEKFYIDYKDVFVVSDLGQRAGSSGFCLDERDRGARKYMLATGGGTKHTELAAVSALAWLANHQGPDGNWRFDAPAKTGHPYSNPGSWNSETGATALALLPFLGVGQTHKSAGPYQEPIRRGLAWIVGHQNLDGDLSADTSPKMLSHALATIALCEAYGLSGDKILGAAAQKGLTFIEGLQDVKSGGWGETAGKTPMVSISAWQIMALDIGKASGLKLLPDVLPVATRFIERNSASDGARFRESEPGDFSDLATAMGLLSSWGTYSICIHKLPLNSSPTNELRARRRPGVEYLVKKGPSSKDVVFNFYATVFLHQNSGPEWDTWNRAMRTQAIESQVKDGNEKGSWFVADDAQAAEGGRLFQTAINTLILETYYRYLPLFK